LQEEDRIILHEINILKAKLADRKTVMKPVRGRGSRRHPSLCRSPFLVFVWLSRALTAER
jgi:hypothetical protein